jgi:hypothetical protein
VASPPTGTAKKGMGQKGATDKTPVLTLIDVETGVARSAVVPRVSAHTLRKIISQHVDMANSYLHTDENASYMELGREFIAHETVNHSQEEWVRYGGRALVTTNPAEGFFAQLKRSINGTHHRVSVTHLPRYLAEFDYRFSTRKMSDTERMRNLMTQNRGEAPQLQAGQRTQGQEGLGVLALLVVLVG